MSFAGALNRMVGNIKVVEKAGVVWVYGAPTDAIERGIKQLWSTSKIAANMFIDVGYGSFSFPSFFAAEVVYMLDKMSSSTNRSVSVRTLARLAEEISNSTWLKNTKLSQVPPRLDYNKLHNLTMTPLDFQQEFFKAYERAMAHYGLNGFILDGAPGSGKTFTSLALSECLCAERVIVICPPNAVERVWQNTITSVYKKAQTYWVAKFGKPYNNERLLVVHYEALSKLMDLVPVLKGYKAMVILDESHNLNELTAMRTNLFIKLCKDLQTRDVVYASGTPVKAMGNELIPILRVIDPLFTDDVEQRYKKIYGKDAKRALDILSHRFGLISFRVEKSELKLLPPIIEKVKVKSPNSANFTLPAIAESMRKYIEERKKYYDERMPEDKETFYECLKFHETSVKDYALYEQYRQCLRAVVASSPAGYRYIIEEIKFCNMYETKYIIPSLSPANAKDFKEVRSTVKYVMLRIKGECLGRVLGRARIDCHMDMVDYVNFNSLVNSTKKKTIVFTSYVEVLDKTISSVSKLGFKPLAVYGKTNSELASIIKEFESNPELDPLVATFNSLSTAVPMTMADVIVMLNAPFRAYIQDQAISRINRLGANTQTYVFMVELDTGEVPNISSRSLDILAWSQQQVASIVGGDIPFDINDINESTGEFSLGTEGISLESFKLESATRTNPVYLNW